MRCRQASTCALLLFCGWALVATTGARADAAEASAAEKRMVRAVNGVRAGHGLPRLRAAPRLGRSAGGYARWMLRADYFGHLGRIRASGHFRVLGENIAWHSGRRPAVRRALRLWLGSAPHRALILSPRFRWLGAGIARGRLGGRAATMWVLHFGG
jgi:uncharacterized protein YkwD